MPLEDPVNGPVGRAPRRLDAAQLRASLAHATGQTWVDDRREPSNEDPSGYVLRRRVDLLQRYGTALGEPDYRSVTEPNLDVSAGFVRLAASAADATCRAAAARDQQVPAAQRVLLRVVGPEDTYARAPEAVRHNVAALARRFWSRPVDASGEESEALLRVFRASSEAPGHTPSDGWITVCVALATDPQFLLY